jgi:uncharacterized protein YutE (UPF0331/DUF86 family)
LKPDKDIVDSKARDIRNSMAELIRLTSKKFEEMSIDELYSMRYQIIVMVEAIGALCSYIALEVYGYEPSSIKDCIAYICERNSIRNIEDMKALVGLRNLLVHRYWTIENKRVYDSIKENFKCVEELLNVIATKYG